jgi:hypothetical protein
MELKEEAKERKQMLDTIKKFMKKYKIEKLELANDGTVMITCKEEIVWK